MGVLPENHCYKVTDSQKTPSTEELAEKLFKRFFVVE